MWRLDVLISRHRWPSLAHVREASIPGGLPLPPDSRAGDDLTPTYITCSVIRTVAMFWKVANSCADATVISFLGSVVSPASLISLCRQPLSCKELSVGLM